MALAVERAKQIQSSLPDAYQFAVGSSTPGVHCVTHQGHLLRRRIWLAPSTHPLVFAASKRFVLPDLEVIDWKILYE